MTATPNVPAGYHAEGRLMVKYELAWNPTDQSATIVRSIYAGVSGPHGDAENVTSREQAEAFAFRTGLIPAGDWRVGGTGEHWVPMTSFKG